MPVFEKHGVYLLFEIVFNGKESTRKIFIMCLVSVYVELVAFNNFAVDLLLEVATLTTVFLVISQKVYCLTFITLNYILPNGKISRF